jgi:hypothetical protein
VRKNQNNNQGPEQFKATDQAWVISLKKTDAERVVALYDGWIEIALDKLAEEQSGNTSAKKAKSVVADDLRQYLHDAVSKLRDRLKNGHSAVTMTVSQAVISPVLLKRVDEVMAGSKKTRNHVLRNSVLEGLPLLSSEAIEQALPSGTRPSLSSVLLVAIETGLPMAETKMLAQKIQPAVLMRETAAGVLKIYDDWSALVIRSGKTFPVADTERIRKEVQGEQESARMAFYAPFEVNQQLEWLAKSAKPSRPKNFWIRQTIERGLDGATGKLAMKEMPGVGPSLSTLLVYLVKRGIPGVKQRFRVTGDPPIMEDGFAGRRLMPATNKISTTVTLPISEAGSIIKRLTELRTAWARRQHVQAHDSQAVRMQKELKEEKSAVIHIHTSGLVRDRIAELARKCVFSRNYVMQWSLNAGLKDLTLKAITEALPEEAPTITNVAGWALEIGLDKFAAEFPFVEP